ncbi:MAG TPA: acriflavin resistance protein [Verrucomicrobia bacterium]|nr:MAG: acriflavin resistance protein [Lentisphaerae bacterium GWF2_57_35]HBA86378.1 acriflavin resistance protein [Verrucomicrobiota bacterium]
MSIARFSVHRPVFVTMAALIVIILGAISLLRIPVDLMPDITDPTISISTTYENASPEEIEELVTRPIEEAMSAVPGVQEVASSSSEGRSVVRVTFAWGTDLDAGVNDIRDRLDRVIPVLPEEADRPALRKFDLASFPILILGAVSDLDPVRMRFLIDHDIKNRIERVPGVAAMDVRGGVEREIQVNLHADKLNAIGIPIDQLVARIRTANVTLPAGSIEAGNYELILRTPGDYTNLEQIRDTAIAIRNGVPVRLGDVADIEDKWQRITRFVRVNDRPGVRLAVNKQSGANTVEVAEQVLAEIERINEDFQQIRIVPIIDTSDYIRRSIGNVGSSIMRGGAFAVLVLLLFLRNIRSTAVISLSIPISIVATFSLIYFGGFTLNLMTLGGLALGVGMLVDNAVVVLENIYRLREEGQAAEEAAVRGTGEVTAAIVASTITTLVVFLPMIFVRGMAGVMFRQLAYVVSFSLICALFVSLTLIPMLASRYIRPTAFDPNEKESWLHKLYRLSGAGLTRLDDNYKRLLHYALSHRALVLMAVALLFGASLLLAPLIGSELMPQSDEGEVRVNLEMEVGSRVSVTEQAMAQVERIVAREVPEIVSVVTTVGGSGFQGGGTHEGEMRLALGPRSQRQRSSEDVAAALRKKLAAIPGATIRTRAGQGLFILRRVSGGAEAVEIEIRGFDLESGDALSRQVKALVEDIPGVTDAQISRQLGSPERIVAIDRAKAEALKLSVRQVAEVLQTLVAGAQAGNYRESGDEYTIRVRLKDAESMSLREILDLTLTNADGQPVVLRNIVSLAPRSGPAAIERKRQERLVTVRANIQGRDLGSVIADARERLRSLPVPAGFSIGFGGNYEDQQKSFRELGLGLALALLLVYMVMACLYESLRDPLVVMFSVPLAVIGVILTLFLTNTTFNMQSYIGCIMLGGIVVNNAILLVDTANRLRRAEGLGLREAVEEAGRRRLRPILMTSLTTILGLMPMALGLGEGGEAQAPLARAVVGGLASSTLITLLVAPVVYTLFENGFRRLGDSTNPATGPA